MKLQIWFNPERGWYEVFFNGHIIPFLMDVTIIKDSFNINSGKIIAEFKANVEIVNEKPSINENLQQNTT